MDDLRERFDSIFHQRALAFVGAVENIDVRGIPEPHLPHWGVNYESSALKIGIVGRDTRGWGQMSNFIQAVKANPISAIHRGEDEFNSLDFTGWTNNFRTSFWDTSMKFLAGLHNIPDWKLLKKRKEESVLRSFFWANVNSVERYEVTPKEQGVAWETWRKIKDASEQHFDSLTVLLDIFRPHIVIVMNWEPHAHFLDIRLSWEEFGNHQAYAFHEPSHTHILAMAHPTWLNRNSLYETAVKGIIQKATCILEHQGLGSIR